MGKPRLRQAVCLQCGFSGRTRRITPGSFWIELVLWCFFLVPGVIYSLWRVSGKYDVCGRCGSRQLVPPDSPVARKLLQEIGERT